MHFSFLLARLAFTRVEARAACECGYTVNSTTSLDHALFTQLLETDFLHVYSLSPDGDWLPQAYNVTPQDSRGPYGKIAQLENVVPNPIASPYDWGATNDPGLQLWVKSDLIPVSGATDGSLMVPMAEIATSRDDILYGSFRIGMEATAINGTCGAFFFYFDDTSEIDLEFLSKQQDAFNLVIQSPNATGPGYAAPGSPDFVNQNLSFAAGAGYHEYRFDWLPGRVDFFVDGELVRTITENVPDTAGRLHVAHWSNGNAGWSGGPPQQDARLVVSYVKAYFNSSSAEGDCGSGGQTCQIPDQLSPPDPSGADGNQTGRTFFFLGPENTTDLGDGGEAGGTGNSSTPAKGTAAHLATSIGSTVACSFMILLATSMMWGA